MSLNASLCRILLCQQKYGEMSLLGSPVYDNYYNYIVGNMRMCCTLRADWVVSRECGGSCFNCFLNASSSG